jgi:protein-tyrosine phosphatase
MEFGRVVAIPVGRFGARPDVTAIVPGLLIGEYATPDDVGWLRSRHGVTAVLSLQDEADLASKGLDLKALECAYAESGVSFYRVPVPDCDTNTLLAELDRIVALVDHLRRRDACVYLHCNAGMNRAPTVAIAYLHARQGMSLAAARDFVKARRHCVPYMRLLQARYE